MGKAKPRASHISTRNQSDNSISGIACWHWTPNICFLIRFNMSDLCFSKISGISAKRSHFRELPCCVMLVSPSEKKIVRENIRTPASVWWDSDLQDVVPNSFRSCASMVCCGVQFSSVKGASATGARFSCVWQLVLTYFLCLTGVKSPLLCRSVWPPPVETAFQTQNLGLGLLHLYSAPSIHTGLQRYFTSVCNCSWR